MATKLKNLRVHEVSLVDRPANKSARVVLMKRDFSASRRRDLAASGHAMPDGSFPIENEEDLHNAIRLAGHSKHPSAARSHIKTRAASMGMSSAIPDEWGGSKSATDPDNDGDDDTTAAGDTDHDVFTPGGRRRKKPLNKATSCPTHGTEFMKDGACTKCMGAYKALNDELDAVEHTLCGEEAYAKVAAIRQAVEKFCQDTEGGGTTQPGAGTVKMTTKTAAEIQKDLDASNAERDFFKAMAGATDAEKDFMKAMKDDAERKAFLAKTADERKALMKKATESDESIVVNGTKIVKSVVGEAIFAVMKSQNEQMGSMAASLAKQEEDRQVAVIEKRLLDAGPVADVTEVAKGIRALEITNKDAAAALEKSIKAAAAQAKKADMILTRSHGSNQALSGSAYEKMQQKSVELRKADPKLTPEQAFTKVFTDPSNAELVAEYQADFAKSAA